MMSWTSKKLRKKSVMRLHRELQRKSAFSFSVAKDKLNHIGIKLIHHHKKIKLQDDIIKIPYRDSTPNDFKLQQWIRLGSGYGNINIKDDDVNNIDETENTEILDNLPSERIDTSISRAVDDNSMLVIIKHYQGSLLHCEYIVEQLHEYKVLLIVQQLKWGLDLLPHQMRINPSYYLITFDKYNGFDIVRIENNLIHHTVLECEKEAKRLERKRVYKRYH